MSFTKLGLRPELVRAVAKAGYETPTPVQQQAIPVALEGRDIFGVAQTGTGKTAAFLLPILQHLSEGRRGRAPRALVVTPTRELAAQIADNAAIYGQYLPLRFTTIFGGVGLNPQIRQLRDVDLIVATPGRLLDHLARGNVSLKEIETLVLDEADRMLDMGFLPDVRRILAALPAKRHNLFFSATLPQEIENLVNRTLHNPLVIEVARRATPAEAVQQVVHPVEADCKTQLLIDLLSSPDMKHTLVFTRTKARANRLAKALDRIGRQVGAIHGNKSQSARTRVLDGFRKGTIDILVATDIAARGLDVDGISHVVNFDLPHVAEDYVHRIGRTARAGASGDAISLVSAEEAGNLRSIERLIGKKIPREEIPGFSDDLSGNGSTAPQRGGKGRGAGAGGRNGNAGRGGQRSPSPERGSRSHQARSRSSASSRSSVPAVARGRAAVSSRRPRLELTDADGRSGEGSRPRGPSAAPQRRSRRPDAPATPSRSRTPGRGRRSA